MRESQWEMPSDVLSVHTRIEAWRTKREKRTPVPSEIWSAAVALAQRYGVYRISQALRLNYGGLKRRLDDRKETVTKLTNDNAKESSHCKFIELSGEGMMAAARRDGADIVTKGVSGEPARMEIEISDGTGARMTIRVSEGSEVALRNLVNSFWSRT
jgi:hypothetical protein